MARLIVTIAKGGEVTMKVTGAPGNACMRLTGDLEKALGNVVSDTKTSEYYQTKEAPAKQKQTQAA